MKLGKHVSLARETSRFVRWLDGKPFVRRVILDRHEVCRHRRSPGEAEIASAEEDTGRVRIKLFTGMGVQKIFVLLEGPLSELVEAMEKR